MEENLILRMDELKDENTISSTSSCLNEKFEKWIKDNYELVNKA